MKNYFLNFSRIVQIVLILIFLLLILVSNQGIKSCVEVTCLYEDINGQYRPIINYSAPLLFFFVALFFVHVKYLKKYLMYAFLPLLLVSWTLILSESPYSTGGALGMSGRPFAATATAYGTIVVSIVFLVELRLQDFVRTFSKGNV